MPGRRDRWPAYRIAGAGASVLLIDVARFPRDKPCGGGLTARAVRELPFSPAPVVEQEVYAELGRRAARQVRAGGGGRLRIRLPSAATSATGTIIVRARIRLSGGRVTYTLPRAIAPP